MNDKPLPSPDPPPGWVLMGLVYIYRHPENHLAMLSVSAKKPYLNSDCVMVLKATTKSLEQGQGQGQAVTLEEALRYMLSDLPAKGSVPS